MNNGAWKTHNTSKFYLENPLEFNLIFSYILPQPHPGEISLKHFSLYDWITSVEKLCLSPKLQKLSEKKKTAKGFKFFSTHESIQEVIKLWCSVESIFDQII